MYVNRKCEIPGDYENYWIFSIECRVPPKGFIYGLLADVQISQTNGGLRHIGDIHTYLINLHLPIIVARKNKNNSRSHRP